MIEKSYKWVFKKKDQETNNDKETDPINAKIKESLRRMQENQNYIADFQNNHRTPHLEIDNPSSRLSIFKRKNLAK